MSEQSLEIFLKMEFAIILIGVALIIEGIGLYLAEV